MIDWDDLLEPEEQILWQGRPEASFRIGRGGALISVFGLFVLGFAILWISLAARISTGSFIDLVFPLFGLPFVLAGLWMVVGVHVWSMFQRRYSFYTLTNRRGFIGADLPFLGRRLNWYDVDPNGIGVVERGGLTDVQFGSQKISQFRTQTDMFNTHRVPTRFDSTAPIAFEALADPAPVLKALRDLPKESAT